MTAQAGSPRIAGPGRPINPDGWDRDLVYLRATRNRLKRLLADADPEDADRIDRAIIRADKLMATIERIIAER